MKMTGVHGFAAAKSGRGFREQGGVELHIEGLTTQTKYYKPLVREFFRKTFQEVRPRWGDFEVHIRMEFKGDPPWMDLDNLAKALLDSACGAVFHDDSQVARLLVERVQADRERRMDEAVSRGPIASGLKAGSVRCRAAFAIDCALCQS
jgi:hypothetical protein